MDGIDLVPVFLTLKLAAVTTAVLLAIGTPLAWWLASRNGGAKAVVEAAVTLPLVLPPTVLGFYMLIALGPRGFIGGTLEALGLPSLAFSFTGLVIGSVLFSLPFVVKPLQSAFELVGRNHMEAAQTLRATPMDTFFSVIMPMCRPAFVSAAVMGFAHTVGEFGVVLMIGGNIPGKTQVVSIAIYNHAEAMEYSHAHMLSAGLLVFSYITLLAVSLSGRRQPFKTL
ncbi:MAG: molybdate ABC transporter permease subunit [Nitrospinae bacterium]|nr:molybdate ABC transporter permease subunit [Nitrospinota bacterium]